jgi:GTPase Era involved in 16S rRNA processing
LKVYSRYTASSTARNHVNEFKPQECANSIWALANLAFNDTELIRGIAFRAVEILTEFRNQNLSNFIWAFAKLGHKDEETTVKVLELSRERLMTFSPQDRTEVALQFVMSISEVLALPRSTFGFRVSSKFFG